MTTPRQKKLLMPEGSVWTSIWHWHGREADIPTDAGELKTLRKTVAERKDKHRRNAATTNHISSIGSHIAIIASNTALLAVDESTKSLENGKFDEVLTDDWFAYMPLIISAISLLLRILIQYRAEANIQRASQLQDQIGKPTQEVPENDPEIANGELSVIPQKPLVIKIPTTKQGIIYTPKAKIVTNKKEVDDSLAEITTMKTDLKDRSQTKQIVAGDISHAIMTFSFSTLIAIEKIADRLVHNHTELKKIKDGIFVTRIVIPLIIPPLAILAYALNLMALRHLPKLKQDSDRLNTFQSGLFNSKKTRSKMNIQEASEEDNELTIKSSTSTSSHMAHL